MCCVMIPARADVPIQSYSVFVDGKPSRPIAAYFDGAHVMVSLENIAAAMRYSIKRNRGTRSLHVGQDAYSFAPGQGDVLASGEVILQCTALPVGGAGCCLLRWSIFRRYSRKISRSATGASTLQLSRPRSMCTLLPRIGGTFPDYTVRTDSSSGSPLAGQGPSVNSNPENALIVHGSVSDYDGFSSRGLSFSTEGARIRGNLDLSEFGNSGTSLTGQIAVGTPERYVQLGYEQSPLDGLLFGASRRKRDGCTPFE